MGEGALQATFDRSLRDPVGFWAKAAEAIYWYKKWAKVLDDSRQPLYRWFVGGELNTCYNALDLHVEQGCGDRPALIYDSPVTNSIKAFTYRQLRDKVATFAGALTRLGVGKGDRVIIYMPMVPEAVVAMLACARLGAVHSVVFGGFAATELATRIDDAKPKVVVSASCGVELQRIIPYKPLLDEALRVASYRPEKCVLVQRPMQRAELMAGRDCDWDEVMEAARPHECVPVAATDPPLHSLYVRHHRAAERGGARQRWSCCGLEMDHEERLWR